MDDLNPTQGIQHRWNSWFKIITCLTQANFANVSRPGIQTIRLATWKRLVLTYLLCNWHGFSCYQRLITGGMPIYNLPIHWNLCSRNHLETHKLLWCDVWYSHSNVAEDSSLLRCDSVSALLFVAFERFILSLASVSNGPKTNIALKMKGLLVLGNIRNYNPQDKITSQKTWISRHNIIVISQ